MALAHMMVDGYGNILAPLLPLLITRLDLSLAAAGTMTMLFQLSASVAQVHAATNRRLFDIHTDGRITRKFTVGVGMPVLEMAA